VVEWSSRGLAAAHTTMATSGAAVRPVTAEEANPDHYSTLVSMVATSPPGRAELVGLAEDAGFEPRGREPNPLSKLPPPLFAGVLAVCNERSSRPGLLGEQGGTRATETRIETTTVWATACDGSGGGSGVNCSLCLLVLHL